MGVEKITDRIIDDAKEYENTVLSEAQKEAADILAEYKTRADSSSEEILSKGKKSAEAIITRAESSAALIRRNQMLQMKLDMIDKVFEDIEEKVFSMPENDLLRLLLSILVSSAESGMGEIMFNERDREKFGDKFVSAANKKIQEKIKDAEFVLSNTTADIKNGFILKYGDIETNCSIEKIISSQRAQLEPQAVKLLFEKRDGASSPNQKRG